MFNVARNFSFLIHTRRIVGTSSLAITIKILSNRENLLHTGSKEEQELVAKEEKHDHN